MSNGTRLVNPPMDYPIPGRAHETMFAAYLVVGVAGALVWDIFLNIGGDYRLLFKCRISIRTVVYFLSRETILIFALTNAHFQTSPLGSCQSVQTTINVLNHITSGLTALLSFLQICVKYKENYSVIAVFLVLWLSVIGSAVPLYMSVSQAGFNGSSGYCTYGSIAASANVGPVVLAANHTFLLLAVAWRRLPTARHPDVEVGKASAPSAKAVSFFSILSRAFVLNGQVYYSLVVLCNWTVVVLVFLKRNQAVLWFSLAVFNLGMTNVMVCREYRHSNLEERADDPLYTEHLTDGPLCFATLQTQSVLVGDGVCGSTEDIMHRTREDELQKIKAHNVKTAENDIAISA